MTMVKISPVFFCGFWKWKEAQGTLDPTLLLTPHEVPVLPECWAALGAPVGQGLGGELAVSALGVSEGLTP